jgi:type II secretory pathway component PulJ
MGRQLLPRRGRGLTLLETLISTAIFSAATAGIFLVYTTMQGTMSQSEMKADLQQNARVGLDRMIQDIRMAGYDPSGIIPQVSNQPRSAIRAAASGCFSFVADVSASGTADQITYSIDGTVLRRRVDTWDAANQVFSGGSAQPQAEGLHLLTFTYFDAYNRVLSPASWTSDHHCPPLPPPPPPPVEAVQQLTFWQMRQIRRISIILRTGDTRPGVASEYFTLTSDVRLRNR